MNSAILLVGATIMFLLGYRFYARYLTQLFGIDPKKPTPAHLMQDGVDYVPTKMPVVFGHHFASIAGAGPIIGPVLGAYFGWVPVILWIVIGSVFVGAVHDFSALFTSVRNKGRSIGHIIERYIGYAGRQLFLLFCFAALVLVVAVFAILVAKTFVSVPAVATSSIFFVILALIFGFLTYRMKMPLLLGSLIFVTLLFGGIYLGVRMPMDLTALFGMSAAAARHTWIMVLMAYVFAASVAPVWRLLQPRDYLNAYLLYGMVLLGFVSIVVAAPAVKIPAFNGFVVEGPDGAGIKWGLFPILFVTVACGACSGFHALVASGTTAKQISSEKDIKPIGYGAMLVEGVVAVMALISVAVLTKNEFVSLISAKGPVDAFASGIAGFSTAIGLPFKIGETFVALTISAFMLTTLDTATRLGRFTVQELCLAPRNARRKKNTVTILLKNRWNATGLVTVLAGYLAFSGDAGKIWPVFGASNQLLAALTFLLVSVVLARRNKKIAAVFIPFIFMTAVSSWALWQLFTKNLQRRNMPLLAATFFLLAMAILVIIQIGAVFHKKRPRTIK